MADVEEVKTKNRISIFARLNQKYGREEVNNRLGQAEGVPSGDFYRFTKDETLLIKKHPDAVYSPTSFKYNEDGWGYVGNLQRWDQVKASKETGEPALVYPFGLNETQLWTLLGNIKGLFPQWSSDIDENVEILDGLLLKVDISPFDFTKPDGATEKRKKIRLSIATDEEGKGAIKSRLEWLKNRISSIAEAG